MGTLLRRYWYPVAAAADLRVGDVRPLRILGEDLVLYRHEGGYATVGRACTHRRADLAYGFVDGDGIRCNYHGWLFGPDGACRQQPYEDQHGDNARFRARCGTSGYPARERAGLLWVYLGPGPAPVLPRYEPFTWPNGFKQIVFGEVPCNWLQCQENSIDPVHFEWLHDNWGAVVLQGRRGPLAPRHLRLDFVEFEHGFMYRRLREDTDDDSPLWRVGRVCLWPNGLFTDDHIEWRVPVDDEHTLSVSWMFDRVPAGSEPFEQEVVPAWTGPLYDENGRPHTAHILNQDFVAWVGQGVIADRSRERLGRSDRGITTIRQRYLQDLEAVAAGRDPKAVLRDPAADLVRLPMVDRERMTTAPTREQILARHKYWRDRGVPGPYIYQAGQPPEVRAAYLRAMGIDPDEVD